MRDTPAGSNKSVIVGEGFILKSSPCRLRRGYYSSRRGLPAHRAGADGVPVGPGHPREAVHRRELVRRLLGA